jgi:hypothetical protein
MVEDYDWRMRVELGIHVNMDVHSRGDDGMLLANVIAALNNTLVIIDAPIPCVQSMLLLENITFEPFSV